MKKLKANTNGKKRGAAGRCSASSPRSPSASCSVPDVPVLDVPSSPSCSLGLTPKQSAFVREYLIDLNATAAYKRAGYKAKNDNVAAVSAHALLRTPKIAASIQAAFSERSQRTEVTADYVVHRLREEADLRGEGSSHSARVRALELLGKHQGMFADRHLHGGDPSSPPISVAHSIEDMTDAELLYIAKAEGSGE